MVKNILKGPIDRMNRLSGNQIKSNILKIGLWTCFGRALGLAKDCLLASFLGIGAQADAFLLAFRIPNMLRTTFAEGSIPGALIPITSILLAKNNKDRVRGLLTLTIVALTLIGFFLWALVLIWPVKIISLVASGLEPLRSSMTAQYLKIIFPFLIIISLCSAIGSVLQSANHFTIQAAGPPILNIIWAISLFVAIRFNLSVEFICFSILLAAFAKLATRSVVLWQKELLPTIPTKENFADFMLVIKRFIPLGLGIFLTLANTLLETQISSFLKIGQISLIHYCFRIYNVPLNTIAIPISNVFLPQISKIADQNRSRLKFYLFETFKLIAWATIPLTILIIFNANLIVELLLGSKSTPEQLCVAANLLKILCFGLFFAVFNKVLNDFFYALHDTKTPTIIWGFSIAVSAIGSLASVFIFDLGAYGILTSATVSWIISTPIKLLVLAIKHDLKIDLLKMTKFFASFAAKITIISLITLISSMLLKNILNIACGSNYLIAKKAFLIISSFLIFYRLIWITRKIRGFKNLKCYFLD